MRVLVARALIGFSFLGAVFLVFGGEFQSAIITGSPLTINVRDEHSLRIWNFTQEGGTTRGAVMVTINGQSANVLSSSMIDAAAPAPETINQVVVAGPAQVTVAPVSGATLFITYRKERDGTGGTSSPTSTPTPTATPVGTATPTPTP